MFTFLQNILRQLVEITEKERGMLIIVTVLIIVCGAVYPYPQLAMWIGFAIAGYSAIANDSIQTIGTFIASNSHRKWYWLWLFMGLIFVGTVTYSWVVFDGDVTHQRLASKGFAKAPEAFSFLQVAAPLILLILTRMRMPVSTTFLLLNTFSTKAEAIAGVVGKSLSGYVLAFITAVLVWFVVAKFANRFFKGKPKPYWSVLQWVISGSLWSIWIMQDAANIAVYLPRSLNLTQFFIFTGYIFFGLGLLFYLKGDRIQGIVNEKTAVTNIRAATIIDFIYALLLFYFKVISTIPISTTWVFIGLLGGRELGFSLSKKLKKRRDITMKRAWFIILKDAVYAAIGLILSMILAMAINDDVRDEIVRKFFPGIF